MTKNNLMTQTKTDNTIKPPFKNAGQSSNTISLGSHPTGMFNTEAKEMLSKAMTNANIDSQVVVNTGKTLVLNVFFDGTGNNYHNTDERKEDNIKGKNFVYTAPIIKNWYDSYQNDYSNVAHLYLGLAIRDDHVNIYIDGAGTTRNSSDSILKGMSSGVGQTGIRNRVNQSFGVIVKEYSLTNKSIPSMVYINVFGFSRGAAAARYFVHAAKNEPYRFTGWNLNRKKIRFRFVGVFDTVSSHGLRHNNDQEEIPMNFNCFDDDDKKITKVFHIKAMDEYRTNFASTNIENAIKGKFGIEVFLNGAHSDVGGGYVNNGKENYQFGKNIKLKEWLEQKRFFKKIISQSVSPIAQAQGHISYRAVREIASNDYHKIPLKIMRLVAAKHGQMAFTSKIIGHESKISGVIKELSDIQSKKIMNEIGSWGKRIDLRLNEDEKMKNLRFNFLHWSVSNGIGMGVNLDQNGLPIRKTISG